MDDGLFMEYHLTIKKIASPPCRKAYLPGCTASLRRTAWRSSSHYRASVLKVGLPSTAFIWVLTEWRRLAPPVNVGAAAIRIFDGAPTQAGSPAEFYCSRPETGRRRGW